MFFIFPIASKDYQVLVFGRKRKHLKTSCLLLSTSKTLAKTLRSRLIYGINPMSDRIQLNLRLDKYPEMYQIIQSKAKEEVLPSMNFP
jgi:hypothetical protein